MSEKEREPLGDLRRKKKIMTFDTTLRDGAQAEGIAFTVLDKIKIARALDRFGIDYIEAGNPGSNPKDLEFFERTEELHLERAKLTAFGSTRRAGCSVEEDENVRALVSAGTPAVAIFAKAWDFHVTKIIRTTLEENLAMIHETVSYLKAMGKEVIFDAEHFFDGYRENRTYAMQVLAAAEGGGADWLVLCDTNGGTLPEEIARAVEDVDKTLGTAVGIHCHNDIGMAVAASVSAVHHGATMVQGTINGYGERCGNANLISILPTLQLKGTYTCVPPERMKELMLLSRTVSELANLAPDERAPYVGNSAFAHKGGMHIDGVRKNPRSFEHLDPAWVGNDRRVLMSEVSGRSTILDKIQRVAPWVTKQSPETLDLMEKLKTLEHNGYQFEGAENSFDLLIRRLMGLHRTFFKVVDYRVFSDDHRKEEESASAVVKLVVDDKEEMTAAEGDGPVNALDRALRKALRVFYPELDRMRLLDYKVRVLDTDRATAAKVRVHITSTDGRSVWGTVGVSTNIIEASFAALIDSFESFLYSESNALQKGETANGHDHDSKDTSSSRGA